MRSAEDQDEGAMTSSSCVRVRPPSTFCDEASVGTDCQSLPPFSHYTNILPDTTGSIAAAAAAAAASDNSGCGDAVTSRRTRCSCDVGCPCCGACVQKSSTMFAPLPTSSLAALRDVDAFIARFRVTSPPTLLPSPSTPSPDSASAVSHPSAMPLNSIQPDFLSEKFPTDDFDMSVNLPRDTTAESADIQSNLDTDHLLQRRNYESVTESNFSGLSNDDSALDLTTHSVLCSNMPDLLGYTDVQYATPAGGVCNTTSFEQSACFPHTSESVSENSEHSAGTRDVDSLTSERQTMVEFQSSLGSDICSSSGVTSSLVVNMATQEYSMPSSENTMEGRVNEGGDSDLVPDTLEPRVPTLTQQLKAPATERGKSISGMDQVNSLTFRPDKHGTATARLRPKAPPPAPPCFNAELDPLSAECDEQLASQTLPRAGSQPARAPPRPPPRSTTPDGSNNGSMSTFVGSSLSQMTLDRISLCQQGHGGSLHQRSLKESGGLSSSVQSLPSFDGSTAAPATTPRGGKPAPLPPRRGSSMSPRLQTKSTRYGGGGGRARSASLKAGDADDVEVDVLLAGRSPKLQAVGCSSTLLGAQQLPDPITKRTSRDATRQTQKPIAQIRPHAIRSPSASSVTRQRLDDDDERKPSTTTPAQSYPDKQSPPRTWAPSDYSSDTQKFGFTGVDLPSFRPVTAPAASSSSVSRFGTIRSKIRDYVTAAASVGTSRTKQQMTPSSSSVADWTLPRGRGGARRSLSATSWEPDRDDYASSCDDTSHGASFDGSVAWSPTSYFGAASGPRPFSSPRTRATEVCLPQNIFASADSSTATDVTSSITSRISTFLTFIGGTTRRPTAATSPTSDVHPSESSASLQSAPATIEPSVADTARDIDTSSVKAVVEPIMRSHAVSSSATVRTSSSSEALTSGTSTVCDVRGRQPIRFVREQRTAMSTFRNSGSLNVSVARSSSFSPYSTSDVERSRQTHDEFQTSAARRRPVNDNPSKAVYHGQLPGGKHLSSFAAQSAPSTPLDWSGGSEPLQSMSSSLPLDDAVCLSPQSIVDVEDGSTGKSASDVVSDVSMNVPQSVFRQVDIEVTGLIELLQTAVPPDDTTAHDLHRRRAVLDVNVEAGRESLLALTRQFVDDCQRLVSGATRSVDALVAGVEPSLATLARLCADCQSTAATMTSQSQGVILVGRVRDLAQAYRCTVSAARSAVGRPFNGVEMKSLMRQATSLAAILSSLIKMLNRTDIIC